MGIDLLIENCKNHDPQAQSELYKLYSKKMYAVCLKYSRNKQEAEDNLQDSFITIFKKIGQYKSKGSFEGWLKRIVINTALQRYRGKSTLNIVNEETIEEVTIEKEDEEISVDFLLSCVQQLPDRYRMVFNLYALDGYSHKEIADMLGVTTGTSKSNLSRARSILKEKIENYKSHGNLYSL